MTALALAFAAAAIVESRAPAPLMPEALRGRWITHEPSHADRYIVLGERTVALGTGGLLGNVSAVRRVSQQASGRRGYVRYRVELMDDGGAAAILELDYRPGIVPTLALPNVPGYWEREGQRWSP